MGSVSCVGPFPGFHFFAVVIPHEVKNRVDERCAPGLSDDVRTQNDIPKLTREALRKRVAAVDRKSERVRLLVDTEVLLLQRPDLVRPDELKAELSVVDSLGVE